MYRRTSARASVGSIQSRLLATASDGLFGHSFGLRAWGCWLHYNHLDTRVPPLDRLDRRGLSRRCDLLRPSQLNMNLPSICLNLLYFTYYLDSFNFNPCWNGSRLWLAQALSCCLTDLQDASSLPSEIADIDPAPSF